MSTSRCRGVDRKVDSGMAAERNGDHANVHFPPPLIHLIAVLAAIVIAEFLPLTLPMSALSIGFGVGLMTISLGIAIMAFREFSRNDNPVPPNQSIKGLMDGGPFRFTRNPLYLALALLHAGIGLASANPWVLASLPPALLVVRYYVIAREEAYLTRRFGQAYIDYQARVRRWF